MFEQEIEMEKHESSVVPLLLISVLILAVVGAAGYFVFQSRQVLPVSDANRIATEVLQGLGPATVHFHTGKVEASVSDKPEDPHYRLLEKLGLITVGKPKNMNYPVAYPVALTPKGQQVLKQIAGVMESTEKDGTESYIVPLADRKLIEISKITQTGTGHATFEYTWKWEPNVLGEDFDAAGPAVKSFSTWDRATLIQKYGAGFYHDPPQKAVLATVKDDKGWQLATE
ncbi:MAG TPA: hypothetical protein VLW84_01460 [Terriglobales bacterium]|nr:hypothetical protein [Terriglobales bacterium]